MNWIRKGQIYDPKEFEGIVGGGYGANPVAVQLEGRMFRIFYNIRDEKNRAHVTYLDYDIESNKIEKLAKKNLISPGEKGTFDDCGCSLGCVLDVGDQYYMYYLGWNLPKTVPFMNTIGLAIYDKKTDTCKKYSPAAILDRNSVDPISISYPYVMFENGIYRMWYGSHISWRNTTFEKYDFLHILKYAESKDGLSFKRDGRICIEGDGIIEYAFSRPSVIKENGIYKMWYTYRGEKYRIGYAESTDGLSWKRLDNEMSFTPSGNGWESDEVSYPCVFSYEGKRYMLYCGNAYGKTGFGLAVQES